MEAAGLSDSAMVEVIHDQNGWKKLYVPRRSSEDTVLNVRYEDKNIAKQRGAEWNPIRNVLIARKGSDLKKFRR